MPNRNNDSFSPRRGIRTRVRTEERNIVTSPDDNLDIFLPLVSENTSNDEFEDIIEEDYQEQTDPVIDSESPLEDYDYVRVPEEYRYDEANRVRIPDRPEELPNISLEFSNLLFYSYYFYSDSFRQWLKEKLPAYETSANQNQQDVFIHAKKIFNTRFLNLSEHINLPEQDLYRYLDSQPNNFIPLTEETEETYNDIFKNLIILNYFTGVAYIEEMSWLVRAYYKDLMPENSSIGFQSNVLLAFLRPALGNLNHFTNNFYNGLIETVRYINPNSSQEEIQQQTRHLNNLFPPNFISLFAETYFLCKQFDNEEMSTTLNLNVIRNQCFSSNFNNFSRYLNEIKFSNLGKEIELIFKQENVDFIYENNLFSIKFILGDCREEDIIDNSIYIPRTELMNRFGIGHRGPTRSLNNYRGSLENAVQIISQVLYDFFEISLTTELITINGVQIRKFNVNNIPNLSNIKFLPILGENPFKYKNSMENIPKIPIPEFIKLNVNNNIILDLLQIENDEVRQEEYFQENDFDSMPPVADFSPPSPILADEPSTWTAPLSRLSRYSVGSSIREADDSDENAVCSDYDGVMESVETGTTTDIFDLQPEPTNVLTALATSNRTTTSLPPIITTSTPRSNGRNRLAEIFNRRPTTSSGFSRESLEVVESLNPENTRLMEEVELARAIIDNLRGRSLDGLQFSANNSELRQLRLDDLDNQEETEE